jgi:exodeoxyribonuclease III
MRLISWNCQGAFRKKADLILALHPDVLVIQECEHPDKYIYNPTNKKSDSQYWYGDSRHKGIYISSFNDCKIELLSDFNPKFRYILPFHVTGHGKTITLLAIWAMNNKENYDARYIGQVWLAINYYADLLGAATILVGDFNSNKIWDYK